MFTLQPLLTPRHGLGSDLCLFSSSDHSELFAFLGTALLERVPLRPEVLRYKMMVGRLVNAGHRLRELQSQFGHDPRTMKRWAAALQSDDAEFALRAFGGRGKPGKVSAALARFVKSRYRELRGKGGGDYRRTIGSEVEEYFGERLSGETLRKLFREADREANREANRRAANKATPCGDKAVSCGSADVPRNQSPAAGGGLPPPPPVLAEAPRRPLGLHHAGTILFAVLLDIFLRGIPKHGCLYRQWIAQILQGAVNIEQSRLVSDEDLGRFAGPIVPGTDPQRAELRSICGLEAVLDIYRANLRLLPDGPGVGEIFYYDPHAKRYTGQLKLLKGWCGSQHGVGKVVYMDTIHTESGRACFARHYCAYHDLRERFFMTLTMFDRIFPDGAARGRTFVLDRGIYGLDAIRRFGATGDWVLTWEKGYRHDGWRDDLPAGRFQRMRARNHADDLRLYQFQWQCAPWERDPSVRRFVVRATNPRGNTIEVAILCSNPAMQSERAIWAMFNRWLQENDFKYLDAHYGINQLTSYASTTYGENVGQFEDRTVESAEHRKAASALRQAEARLARALLAVRKAERARDRAESQIELLGARIANAAERADEENRGRLAKARAELARARKKIAGLTEKAEEQERQADRLREELESTLRDASRLETLLQQNYQLLDIKAKATFDALRIAAANMFASLVANFRPVYKNYRNDHAMLRMITRADGFIHAEAETVHLKLWLKGRFQKRQIKAFKRFLAEAGEKANRHFEGRAKTVRISLVDALPTWQ